MREEEKIRGRGGDEESEFEGGRRETPAAQRQFLSSRGGKTAGHPFCFVLPPHRSLLRADWPVGLHFKQCHHIFCNSWSATCCCFVIVSKDRE